MGGIYSFVRVVGISIYLEGGRDFYFWGRVAGIYIFVMVAGSLFLGRMRGIWLSWRVCLESELPFDGRIRSIFPSMGLTTKLSSLPIKEKTS